MSDDEDSNVWDRERIEREHRKRMRGAA